MNTINLKSETNFDNTLNKHNTRVGFIGLGLMGSRFVRRLNAEGWKVRAWNRTRNATLPLSDYGLQIEDTLAGLVRGSDVLLSSLADDKAVQAVYLGKDGVLANVQPGTVILEMSTISPCLSALLHIEARKRGAHLMDVPVSGSTPAVEAGTVTLFAGGEEEIFQRCIPLFDSIARQWYLIGPATAGIRMKLVVNLLLGINMEAIAEALSLADNLRLSRNLLLEILPKTAVVAPALLGKFGKIRAGDYSPQFPLHLMSKDMNLVHGLARGAGAHLPVANAARLIFEDALTDSGNLDLAAIAPYVLSSGRVYTDRPVGGTS